MGIDIDGSSSGTCIARAGGKAGGGSIASFPLLAWPPPRARMVLHADTPSASEAPKRLNELGLFHRSRGQEDEVALEALDDSIGAHKRAEQRQKVAEHEHA